MFLVCLEGLLIFYFRHNSIRVLSRLLFSSLLYFDVSTPFSVLLIESCSIKIHALIQFVSNPLSIYL